MTGVVATRQHVTARAQRGVEGLVVGDVADDGAIAFDPIAQRERRVVQVLRTHQQVADLEGSLDQLVISDSGAELVQGELATTLSARGADGGQALGEVASGTWGWAGGGGGGGRIKVFAPTYEFTGTYEVDGGAGGTHPADADSYGGLAGQEGSAVALGTIPPALDTVSCD